MGAPSGSARKFAASCRVSASPDVLLDCQRSDTFPKGCRPDGPKENAVGGLNSERFAIVYCGVTGEEERLRLFDPEQALVSTIEFRVRSSHLSGHVAGSKLLLRLEDGGAVLLRIEDDWFQ